LQEEEATDKKLTELGESGINEAAAMAGEEDDEEE
jgi:ferritin-like metal-binding protein YciE